MLTKRRLLLILTVGLILAGTVAYGQPSSGPDTASASDGGPEMRLAVKSGGECDDSTCTIPSGGSFTLAVEIVTIPDGGYILVQTSIFIGPNLVYKPADAPGDEFVWPDCVSSVALRSNLKETSWLHGCITGLLPPLPASTYTGNLLELKLNCSEDDTSTEVRFILNDNQLVTSGGTFFANPEGVRTVPKTSNLTVVCGSAPGPTNTPHPTDTPVPPTSTPVPPTSTPVLFGDANCDGAVDAMDAALILQFEAGLLSTLPCAEKLDVNDDGLLNSLDAALILQFASDLIQQLPVGNTE